MLSLTTMPPPPSIPRQTGTEQYGVVCKNGMARAPKRCHACQRGGCARMRKWFYEIHSRNGENGERYKQPQRQKASVKRNAQNRIWQGGSQSPAPLRPLSSSRQPSCHLYQNLSAAEGKVVGVSAHAYHKRPILSAHALRVSRHNHTSALAKTHATTGEM